MAYRVLKSDFFGLNLRFSVSLFCFIDLYLAKPQVILKYVWLNKCILGDKMSCKQGSKKNELKNL